MFHKQHVLIISVAYLAVLEPVERGLAQGVVKLVLQPEDYGLEPVKILVMMSVLAFYYSVFMFVCLLVCLLFVYFSYLEKIF
jgi:hypothetical protein